MALQLKAPEAKPRGRKARPSAAPGPGSLVQKVSHAVIQYMRDQQLGVGDTLPSEAEIALTLQVSRTVVREAFGALAALKLIDVGSGRRARVGKIDHSMMALTFDHAVHTRQMSVQHIWDVRRCLEIRTAALAANRRTDAEAGEMLFHAGSMRRLMHNRPEMVAHDVALHNLIAQATRNALFHNIIASFGVVMLGTVTDIDHPDRESAELIVSLHERLAQAIADRDAAGATAAMKDHFTTSLRVLVDAGFY